MSWPKQVNPASERRAKAPYNFIPLPEKVLAAEPLLDQDRYHASRHTGWMSCTLTTASPLYVRCGVLPEDFGQENTDTPADFFYTDPDTLEPVIPGSSLRGIQADLTLGLYRPGSGDREPGSDQRRKQRYPRTLFLMGEHHRQHAVVAQHAVCLLE